MSAALTRSRFINAVRCSASYALSRLGLVRISHGPMFVSVEPASICQLRCPECPVGMRRKEEDERTKDGRMMSREVWQRTLEQVTSYAHTMQFYFQGEPLLNKDLPTMIREANEAGLYTIVSTNAQALTRECAESLIEAGLHRIIVSMDGLSEESYSSYRVGGSVTRCKEALRELRAAKKRLGAHTLIELQCLRLRTNEHEWKAFKREYRALGADRLVFKTAQLYNYQNGHPLMPSDSRFSRYEKGIDGTYQRKKLGKGCWRVWSGCVITTNGNVLPCCYDKGHEHAYGNIMQHTLYELFNNEKAGSFRQIALNEQPDICKECWR